MTTFREAMDMLCVPAPQAAEMFSLSAQTVRQMRLNPSHPNYRNPPATWRATFARLARERGERLEQLAVELEQ
jgi:signal recognition particle subunit SEC65